MKANDLPSNEMERIYGHILSTIRGNSIRIKAIYFIFSGIWGQKRIKCFVLQEQGDFLEVQRLK